MDRLSEPADSTAELSPNTLTPGFGGAESSQGTTDGVAARTAAPAPAPAAAASPGPGGGDRRPGGLTRVAIDTDRIVDEQSAAWCRHEVRRIVAWHVIATAAVAFAVFVPLLWWSLAEPLMACLLALVAAALVAAARLGFALAAAPLGYRYVERFSNNPPEYLLARSSVLDPAGRAGSAPSPFPPPVPSTSPGAPTAPMVSEPADVWDLDPDLPTPDVPTLSSDLPTGPVSGLPDQATVITGRIDAVDGGPLVDLDGQPVPERHSPTADVLHELGFAPVATLRTEGVGGRYIDLYGDRDRIVVAVDRTTATTTVLTELAGFRVLVTSALLVPPTDELVVNVVADGDAAGLVLSHQRLVQQAFRSRTRVSEPVGLFKLAQQRELEAYRELGPLWGAVLDLRCRSRGVRLLAAPSAGDVLLFTGNRLFKQTARERSS